MTKKLYSGLLLLAAATFSINAQAGRMKTCNAITDYLHSSTTEYALTHSGFPGTLALTTHEFIVVGKQYKLTSTSKAIGFLSLLYSGTLNQKSEGVIERGIGLGPIYYSEQRGKKPLQETVIDTVNKKVLFKKNNTSAPLEDRLQDRLSMIYEMSAMLNCAGKVEPGDVFQLKVMTTGALDPEPFEYKGMESVRLNLPKGTTTVEAAKFELAPANAGDDTVRLWFAPKMQWKAVQIQVQDDKGATLTQTMVSSQ